MPSSKDMSIADLWKNIKEEFKTDREKFKMLLNEVKDIKTSHCNLEGKVNIIEGTVCNVTRDLQNLQSNIARIEQTPLNCDLFIRGVPEKRGEELGAIVLETFKVVNPANSWTIVAAYRLGSGKRRPILVKMQSMAVKNQIMKEKKRKLLNCSEINVNGEKLGTERDIIFFGEHLGPLNARIYYIARRLTKQKLFVHCWTRNGKTFVRKEEGDSPYIINHESNFAEILGASVVANFLADGDNGPSVDGEKADNAEEEHGLLSPTAVDVLNGSNNSNNRSLQQFNESLKFVIECVEKETWKPGGPTRVTRRKNRDAEAVEKPT